MKLLGTCVSCCLDQATNNAHKAKKERKKAMTNKDIRGSREKQRVRCLEKDYRASPTLHEWKAGYSDKSYCIDFATFAPSRGTKLGKGSISGSTISAFATGVMIKSLE